jgi:hypothetical protein
VIKLRIIPSSLAAALLSAGLGGVLIGCASTPGRIRYTSHASHRIAPSATTADSVSVAFDLRRSSAPDVDGGVTLSVQQIGPDE